MSLKHAANHLAAHGRGPDTELIHMTKGEINGLQQLAKSGGGSLTINPHTGLVEAGFLSNMLPMIAGAAAMYFSGGTAAPLLGGLGMGMSSAGVIGTGLGALQYARTGSLQKGLMAGLGAYGGAGLAGGLMGAGAGAAANAAPVADAGIGASQAPAVTNAVSQGSISSQALPKMADYGLQSAGGVAPGSESMASRIAAAGANTGAGAVGGMNPMLKYGLAAAAPALMAPQNTTPTAPAGDSTMPQRLKYNVGRPTDAAGNTTTPAPDVPGYGGGMGQDFGRERNYFPTAGYQNITPEEAKKLRGYADGGMPTSGGPVERMSNQNAIGANTGYPMANANQTAYATPYQTPVSQNVVSGPQDVGVNSMTGEQNEFANGGSVQNFAFGGFAQAAEQVSGGGGGSPSAASGNVFDGGIAKLVEKLRAEGKLANGGLSAAYAAGGMSHLGDYSDGGRLLKGPGDGVSDSIPAVIGNKRPARLADGEFVVPARIVSELGNGSTEAGARKLYAMLDRVQAVRKKSIGKGKVAKNSRADNLLPA